MRKISIIGIILGIFLTIGLANATQSFTTSPSSFTQTVFVNGNNSGIISITNTGNESINLTISKSDLVNGANNIALVLNQTSVNNLNNGSSAYFKFSYTASTVTGNFSGSVVVVNTQNNSQSSTIPVSVTVNPLPSGASLNIVDTGNTVIVYGDLDQRKTKTVVFQNDGSIDMTGLKFTVSDLFGDVSNDEIRSSEVGITPSSFNLAVGDRRSVDIEVDIPRNIAVDTYEGTMTVTTNGGYTFKWTLRVITSGQDIVIDINQNWGDVQNGILTMIGKAGDSLRNYDFTVSNDGNVDVNNLQFKLDGDLKGELSSNTIPASAITFFPSTLDLQNGNDDSVEVRANIPENQPSGDYYANIKVLSASGDTYDTIRLKIKVTGDVYIDSLTYDKSLSPGDVMDVAVKVNNQGSEVYRNVVVSGTLYNIDSGSTDLHESSSSFLLDVGQDSTQTLRFKIPKDASDGSHTLEIRVNYGNQQVTDVQDVQVSRPVHNLVVNSFAINPPVVSCGKNVYTYMKIRNLGKYDEDIKMSSEISGTDILEQSNLIDVPVDNSLQKNFVLNTKGLAPGDYTVIQKVIYAGSLFIKKQSDLRVDACENLTGIIIKPLNETQLNKTAQIPSNKVNLFGKEISKSTVYIGSGLTAVILLIIISLFLL